MLAFAALSALIEITPGPNMVYLAALSMERGIRAGLAAVAGVALGLAIMGSLAATGGAEFVARSPVAGRFLGYAGVAYMVYLAVETWRGGGDGGAGELSSFRAGLITNLLNIKAALFFMTVLPRFIDLASAWSAATQALVLLGIYVMVATVIHAGIVLTAAPLGPVLHAALGKGRLRALLGGLLVAVAVWMLMLVR